MISMISIKAREIICTVAVESDGFCKKN